MIYDCQTCGACCCNPDENRAEGYLDYVEVAPYEPLATKGALLKRFTVLNAHGERHMRLQDHRCSALKGPLGKRVECLIYEQRPTGCHQVEAGSLRCLQYRQERGI